MTRPAAGGGCRRSAPGFSCHGALLRGAVMRCRGASERRRCSTAWRADDPAPMRSRRDLRRVHRAMGTRSILLRALRQLTPPGPDAAPLRVLELGAGDGTLMLGVARALAPWWPPVELTLLDRQALVDRRDHRGFAGLGLGGHGRASWTPSTGRRVERPSSFAPTGSARWDLIIANLFLHHFEGAQLAARARCSGRGQRAVRRLRAAPRLGRAGGQSPGRRDWRRRGDTHGCRAERARGLPRQRTLGTVAGTGADWERSRICGAGPSATAFAPTRTAEA